MSENAINRVTIDKVDQSLPMNQRKPQLADLGHRRHLSYSFDFDARAAGLSILIQDSWDENVKQQHVKNREQTKHNLAAEFGTDQIESKIENLISIDTKPTSIIAYHNRLYDQVRRSFVIGSYYPALVSSCTLGERILNHLVLGLREHYKGTPDYKKVYRKKSFDDWRVPIDTLEAWGVLLPKAVSEYRALMELRNRSIHFNMATYVNLKEDALAAVLHMREIIDQQFGTFARRPWFIEGTAGFIFIKREWEDNPFIKTYFLPNCPLVGPHFAVSFGNSGPLFHDFGDYGDGDWTDEEFAAAFQARTPDQVAKTE